MSGEAHREFWDVWRGTQGIPGCLKRQSGNSGMSEEALMEFWLSLWEMESATKVQNLNEAFCILLCTNALGKGINLTSLGNQSRRRKNSELKPVILSLKIDLVSHPAHQGGVGQIHTRDVWKVKDKHFLKFITKWIKHCAFVTGTVFANGPEEQGSITGQVIPKTQKMVLDAFLLNTQHYKVQIKGK